MRASFQLAIVASDLVSVGGKVIFDTGSSAGGASTSSTNVSTTHASTTHASTGVSVVTGVTTTAISVTTGTGGSCFDPLAPPGATVGTTDCSKMPCTAASTCEEVCSALYDCGLAKCGPGA